MAATFRAYGCQTGTMRHAVTALLLCSASLPALAEQRTPQPMSVPLVTYGPASSPPAVTPSPSAPVIVRPPVITSCDSGGCWDSNGTRRDRAGPALVGPSGVCTVQGNLLACPP